MNKVNREQAQSEIDGWLDYKKIGEKKRESNQEFIDSLVEAVVQGYLIVEENHSLTQKLRFAVEGDLGFEELTYKPRVNAGIVQMHLQKVKIHDLQGMAMAYACALTDKSSALLKKVEQGEDWSLLQAIVIFFM